MPLCLVLAWMAVARWAARQTVRVWFQLPQGAEQAQGRWPLQPGLAKEVLQAPERVPQPQMRGQLVRCLQWPLAGRAA